MKKNEFTAIIIFLIATVGTIVGIFSYEGYRRARFYTVDLIARSPLNGNWYPKKFTIPFGKEARLRIRNIETVSHGFAIPDLQVGVREIKAGEVVIVKFTPDRKGVFPFMCTVWCSNEHLQMNGEIAVE
jgi:heme/copper-type cytochrome/quinol oxidase subunit 2